MVRLVRQHDRAPSARHGRPGAGLPGIGSRGHLPDGGPDPTEAECLVANVQGPKAGIYVDLADGSSGFSAAQLIGVPRKRKISGGRWILDKSTEHWNAGGTQGTEVVRRNACSGTVPYSLAHKSSHRPGGF